MLIFYSVILNNLYMNKNEKIKSAAVRYVESNIPNGSKYEKNKVINDWIKKEKTSLGVVEDFKKRAGEIHGKKILEIGFGGGITLATFFKNGGEMYGIEIENILLDVANKFFLENSIIADVVLYDGINFPFKDCVFDYSYSISVLEHTEHPENILKEAYRTLKSGGKFYLAFPNKLYPKETHTGVWFISYLPRQTASIVLKILKRGTLKEWSLYFRSYIWLRKILKSEKIKFKIKLEPEGGGIKGIVKKSLAIFGIHHSAILPHVMVVLEK